MTQELQWHLTDADRAKAHIKYELHDLKRLFSKQSLELWLDGLVDFCNRQEVHRVDFATLFYDWHASEHQVALSFFSNSQFIDLVNAIFFYKLNPEKLFTQLIHPEKLVSARVRLGVLHYYIELMQRQLYSISLQNGLTPSVDYLLHGTELPQGATFEVDPQYQSMIQSAIKKLKITFRYQNNKQENLELLHDLRKAYKFWFNPNVLIDAAMVLQQHLAVEQAAKDRFQQEMVILFCQLTTTECLDLYGYFSNKDTRYLLHTVSSLAHGKTFDWLPSLNEAEQSTIKEVYYALSSVMEALRIELKNRHVNTEPFAYIINKENIHIGHRNREAVFRAIEIYGGKMVIPDVDFELFEEA